jgi:phospho-N-acetylmuramoyl-pentapeptide-transferase
MIPMELMRHALSAFVVALVVAGVFAWPVLKGLIVLKSRQTIYSLAPEGHQKKQGTPTMGGIVILLGLIAGILAFNLDVMLIIWLVAFALIGFTDDFIVPRLMKGKRGLGWKQKIVAQVFLALAALPLLHLPWQPAVVALTVFSVLFFSNAYNFADGLDGLAGSLGLLLCLGFISLAQFGGDPRVVPVLAALAGAYIPFLLLNAPPAKVFMGDVGSLPLGALFGLIAVNITVHPMGSDVVWSSNLVLPILVLSFVMIAELVPVPMQVAFYKLTKKRLFPMTPIHHSFEVKGWPESRVVWSFFLAQLTLVVLSIGLAIFTLPPLVHQIATIGGRR